MWSFSKPDATSLQALLAEQAGRPLTYPAFDLAAGPAPPGFVHDDNRVLLGHGPAVFAQACETLRQWRHYPPGWTEIFPAQPPLAVGQPVAVLAHLFGLWWANCCRIVSVIDEPGTRFGFAYGTLPRHVESGEERFLVERLSDGGVWYSIRAVSRPHYWMVRLAHPLARRVQKRFARDSLAAMRAAVLQGGFGENPSRIERITP